MLLDSNSTHYINYDLIIKDYGCGISSENIKRLFMDFNKLEENSANNKNGVGLGLSISKKLIEMMGGNVSVDSALGSGSTFTINFKSSCVLSHDFTGFENS